MREDLEHLRFVITLAALMTVAIILSLLVLVGVGWLMMTLFEWNVIAGIVVTIFLAMVILVAALMG